MHVDLEKLCSLFDEVKDEFQREANQAILKKDFSQGMAALGGLDAVQRVERRVSVAFGVPFRDKRESKVTVLRGKRA